MSIQAAALRYGFDSTKIEAEPLHSGLINSTWKITTGGQAYILQKINHSVFKDPTAIASNIKRVADYLQAQHPDYLFIRPIKTIDGEEMALINDDEYFRLFPFINGSHTIDVLQNPEQAYQSARQFGRFTYLLRDFDVAELQITIPHFHNLSYRYKNFLTTIKNASTENLQQANIAISKLQEHDFIAADFEKISNSNHLPKRVIHHDTKISNVLFDEKGKGLCVIDLDTLMPGYFISDLGDMIRTCIATVSEEEKDFSRIHIRPGMYQALISGYSEELGRILSPEEKRLYFYSGTFLIYMQALRFLTDFLNNNSYYSIAYPDHNLVRAQNQIVLLERLIEQKKELIHATRLL